MFVNTLVPLPASSDMIFSRLSARPIRMDAMQHKGKRTSGRKGYEERGWVGHFYFCNFLQVSRNRPTINNPPFLCPVVSRYSFLFCQFPSKILKGKKGKER
jgi:hypothetical protein